MCNMKINLCYRYQQVSCEGRGHVVVRIRSYKNPSHRGIDNKCCDNRFFSCTFGCDAYFKLCVTLSASSLAHNCSLGIIKTGVVGRRDDHTFDENRYKKSFAFSSFLVSAIPDINAENSILPIKHKKVLETCLCMNRTEIVID